MTIPIETGTILDRILARTASDLVDLVHDLFGWSLAAGVVNYDLRAPTTQLLTYRGPYAPASTRDDRNRTL